MPILVLSDIHSNRAALEAVLSDAGEFDAIWCLGDMVGYGAKPNACIEILREHATVAIPGNHDWGVLGAIDLEDFNLEARRANLWTREQLSDHSRADLESLPTTRVESGVTLAHGSPRSPIWEYLIYASIAEQSFDHFDTQLCLVGHTHVPVIFRQAAGERCVALRPAVGQAVQLDDARYIINPGSVGQPRDGDPRAAYMMLDIDTLVIEHRRVEYDVAATQQEIKEAGLPRRLAERLSLGW